MTGVRREPTDDERDSWAEWAAGPRRFAPAHCAFCGRFVGRDAVVDEHRFEVACGRCAREQRLPLRYAGPLPEWARDPDAELHFRLTGEEPSMYDYLPF